MRSAEAATIHVAAGGDLQAALNAASPGDTILLAEGAEFVGNFVLPAKTGDGWITLRTSAPLSVLPPSGVRIGPAQARLLARLRSPNEWSVLVTAPGAHHWRIEYLEFAANFDGLGDIMQLGDGSGAQNSLSLVPHHFVLSHLYIHGDPRLGQKRCISLHAANVTIKDSYISDCKAVGQDSQAIAGWNGPGQYLIENNYLEAAGENIMFGGADPAIPNLVPDGITIRRNHLTRPLSWRNPIFSTPSGVTAQALTGGTLQAGTYAYRVVARGPIGRGFLGRSTASAEVSVAVPAAGGAVRVRWQAVSGATEYAVYGRTGGAQNMSWVGTTTEFVDTGAAGTPENVPTSRGTVWTVKNLFELKAGRNVVLEGNVFENHWREAQPGYSVVLTPRNSNGGCTWCVVEHVRFEYNLFRNIAAGINLTGYDAASRPTLQSNNIVVRNNLFTGMSTSLGGNGWFMLVGDSPRDLVIEHNTIDANGSAVTYTHGGSATDPKEVYGLRMIANAARHGLYGINGTNFTYGNAILANYYPDGVFLGNYLAGGSASRYPAGNLFSGSFADQFVDAAAGDYTLRSGSLLRGAAPDGSNIGVDFGVLSDRIAGVVQGVSDGARPPAVDFTSACTYLDCRFTDASVAGSSAIASRAWSFGDGGHSTSTSPTHSFPAAGTYTVTLTVADVLGVSASASRTLQVQAQNAAPVAAFQSACTDFRCSFTDRSTDADGSVVSWNWNFGAAGTSSAQSPTVTFPSAGTYTVTLTVTDNDGARASTAGTVQLSTQLHAAVGAGTVSRWNSQHSTSIYYWSAAVPVVVHGAGEGAVAGATVTGSWSGAVTKTVTCVTDSAGSCTFKSGTLSMLRSWVAFTVTGVSKTGASYLSAANHRLGSSVLTSSTRLEQNGTASAPAPSQVTSSVHAAVGAGTTTRWDSRYTAGTHYWSATVPVVVHSGSEGVVAGATVSASWTGAVTRTDTCVTDSAGTCTFKSGTLSMLRSSVALTVNTVSVSGSSYTSGANHRLGSSELTSTTTLAKP